MKTWHTYKIEMHTRTGIIRKLYSAISNADAIRRSTSKLLWLEYRNSECLAYEIISMRTGKIVDKKYNQSYYDCIMDSL